MKVEPKDGVIRAASDIAAAIERKDTDALAGLLAPGFVYRSPGAAERDGEAFLRGVREIPGEIVFVRLVDLEVDLSEDAGALATGVQHARVRIEGSEVDDRRAFVDWFVAQGGAWKLRVAVDLPFSPT